jgi:hypothetical protein
MWGLLSVSPQNVRKLTRSPSMVGSENVGAFVPGCNSVTFSDWSAWMQPTQNPMRIRKN